MNKTRIPKAFYRDHVERDLPAPPVLKETARHYWIDASHPDADELLNDAEYYADPYGPDASWLVGLRASARATAKAIREVVR